MNDEILAAILREIARERMHQVAKGYTAEHDDKPVSEGGPKHMTMLFNRLNCIKALPPTSDEVRRFMIELVAIGVAIIESIDRKRERGE